jgi:hypothetical protein
MMELRYGQGEVPTISWYFTIYRTMLRIVAAALDPLVNVRMGKGAIKIGKAPWLRTDDMLSPA